MSGEVTEEKSTKVRAWKLYLLAASFSLSLGVAVAAWLLVSSNPPEAFSAADPSAIGVRIKDAQVELRRGDPAVALERLQRIRTEDPLNPMVHALIGRALAREDARLAEAIASTRMALSLDPLFTTAWYNLSCYYARAGDLNGSIWSLAEAVAIGFEDRVALAKDSDLELLRSDPRVQFFIDGHGLPSEKRFADLKFSPERPALGEPFEMILTLWELQWPGGEPEFSLTYLGSQSSQLLQPVDRKIVSLTNDRPGRVGWQVTYQLVARGAFAGAIGPWDLRVGEQKVTVNVEPLRITLPEHRDFPEPEKAFDMASFFNVL